MKPDLAVPHGRHRDIGLHRSFLNGRHRYRVWWWENGTTKSRLIAAETVEEARDERDRIHAALVAEGAERRPHGAKTPQARIRNAKLRGSKRESYITVQVRVQGVQVGSFLTMEEAIEARDTYLAEQAELRKRLREIKRAIA